MPLLSPPVLCVQFDIDWENKPANFSRMRRMVAESRPPPGALVMLPEMCATGFSMNVAAIAEPPGGETESFLAGLARERRCHVLGGVVTRDAAGRGRNEAVGFSPEGETVRYAKMRPFSLTGETKHYVAGEKPALFDWNGWRTAPFVCYDLRFPELFRAAARSGAELFLVIANWPQARIHHWRTLLQARAIENQACIAAVNRCGSDPRLRYNGHSMIIDSQGEILAEAGEAEQVIRAGLDLEGLRAWRAEFPALSDMRL